MTHPELQNIFGTDGNLDAQPGRCRSDGCAYPASGPQAATGPFQPPEGREAFCGTCLSWLDKATEPRPGTIIVEWHQAPDDGSIIAEQYRKRGIKPLHCYYVDPEKTVVETGNPDSLGFGGTPFRLLLPDGRSLETNNLQHEGDVPVRFHHLFPARTQMAILGYYGGERRDGNPPLHRRPQRKTATSPGRGAVRP